ncbi:G/U mismatch-specific uracil DNA glycosylase [Colletotrichum sp. SAR 10_70]|nr:G/U mismatch-specific uracil DNA glycosylase [Colletotrichum sp. SAR 10_70]KAI8162822.1 G/U mismatch-specific uracil DNA glycosylase [Colletotrichum sp. SAR 10_71]KAI8173629.1 G/U mismatch-specific uracil DNA glycosylase [Colletotrichum sp. SAR 10_75]KAJ4998876.1 G/U mismatch-specific uracil DNA glycosylase [Colletotrichum sp. SAR 10_66]
MESPFFDGAEPQPKPASFQGRLQLQDFMFKHESPSPAASPSPAPSPLRRSPRKQPPHGGPVVRSPARVTKPTSTTPRKVKAEPPSTADDEEDTSLQRIPPRNTATKAKRKRQATGYAPPSTYAHLSPLVDILAPDLLILFVGLNPGLQTARSGHVYAHPSNLFWKLLHSSGITPRLCAPQEDRELPALYGLGNTNIVARPSRNGAELSKAEMDEGVGVLEEKVRRCRPETVCIVGKSIWESIWRVRHGRGVRKEEFRYGWQDEGENMGVVRESGNGHDEKGEAWAGARVFVATSTSGLAATLRPAEKERIWRELGEWCETRRAERDAA